MASHLASLCPVEPQRYLAPRCACLHLRILRCHATADPRPYKLPSGPNHGPCHGGFDLTPTNEHFSLVAPKVYLPHPGLESHYSHFGSPGEQLGAAIRRTKFCLACPVLEHCCAIIGCFHCLPSDLTLTTSSEVRKAGRVFVQFLRVRFRARSQSRLHVSPHAHMLQLPVDGHLTTGFLFLSFLFQLLQAPGHLCMRGDWTPNKSNLRIRYTTCQGLEQPKARLAACPVTVTLSSCVRTVRRTKDTKRALGRVKSPGLPRGHWASGPGNPLSPPAHHPTRIPRDMSSRPLAVHTIHFMKRLTLSPFPGTPPTQPLARVKMPWRLMCVQQYLDVVLYQSPQATWSRDVLRSAGSCSAPAEKRPNSSTCVTVAVHAFAVERDQISVPCRVSSLQPLALGWAAPYDAGCCPLDCKEPESAPSEWPGSHFHLTLI